MPRGTLSGSLQFYSLSPRQKRSHSKSWIKVFTLPTLSRQQYSHTPSLLGANTYPCRIPNQGAPSQHQEVHLPHEGRSFTASVRARWCHWREALRAWRRWTRVTVAVPAGSNSMIANLSYLLVIMNSPTDSTIFFLAVFFSYIVFGNHLYHAKLSEYGFHNCCDVNAPSGE